MTEVIEEIKETEEAAIAEEVLVAEESVATNAPKTPKEAEELPKAPASLADRPKSTSKNNKKRSPHDKLFKAIFGNEASARGILKKHLPEDIKKLLDLDHLEIENNNFVDEDLKETMSDIVYKIKTKNQKKDGDVILFLCEHQSSNDKKMMFRLWKYAISAWEPYLAKNKSLPIIAPLVLYNGKRKYSSYRRFWDLFVNSDLAEKIMAGKCQLIDLQSMPDEDILADKEFGLFKFFMKNIKKDNGIELWKECFKKFREHIELDKEQELFYTKLLWSYTGNKVPIERKQELVSLILEQMEKIGKNGEEEMKTVADSYREEGRKGALEEGIFIGEERGEKIGEERGEKIGVEVERKKTVARMLKENFAPKIISSITGMSQRAISKLRSQLKLQGELA